jgi:putative hydrolase of the HAD superfamily
VPELPGIAGGLGLGPYVGTVLTSARIGYEKPHPEAFRRAVRAAGQNGPVWMVGDNLNADVLGAQAVGLEAILVRQDTTHPVRIAPDVTAAAAIITSTPCGRPGGRR